MRELIVPNSLGRDERKGWVAKPTVFPVGGFFDVIVHAPVKKLGRRYMKGVTRE